MFRKNLVVHQQEHGRIYCITQFGTIGTIVQASLAAKKLWVTQSQILPKIASNLRTMKSNIKEVTRMYKC